MLAGFGRRASGLSCWGLVLVQVLQVEPVRLDAKQWAAVEDLVDWDTLPNDAAVYAKKVTHRVYGVWWYFVVKAICEDTRRHVACFIHVRRPAPSRGSQRWLVSDMSVSAAIGSTYLFAGAVAQDGQQAVVENVVGRPLGKQNLPQETSAANGAPGKVLPIAQGLPLHKGPQNAIAANFAAVLENPALLQNKKPIEALQEVFKVLCSTTAAKAVTKVPEIGAKGDTSKNRMQLEQVKRGSKTQMENAVLEEIQAILTRYYIVETDAQELGIIKNPKKHDRPGLSLHK